MVYILACIGVVLIFALVLCIYFARSERAARQERIRRWMEIERRR